MTNFKASAFSLLLSLGLSGCVKLQVLPENSIRNGVNAGKNLVTEAKLARSGGKKITMSTEFVMEVGQTKASAEKACFSELELRAQAASPQRNFELLSEASKIAKNGTQESIVCEVTVYVWK